MTDIFDDSAKKYPFPSYPIPSNHERIHQTVAEIVEERSSAFDRINSLLDWITSNIDHQTVDVFTAMDVLEGKKAECQGHT